MKKSSPQPARSSEHGGAGVKFLIIVVVLFMIAHAGYAYVPTAYQCEDYRQRINEVVTNAFAMPLAATNSPEMVKQRLRNYGNEYAVPLNAFIKVDKMDNGGLKAQVKFSKDIDLLPLGLYKYHYEFDHTAAPNGFLTKQ
jgi:hypothetical protein